MIRTTRLYEAAFAFALLTSQVECFSTPLPGIDRTHTSSIVSNNSYHHANNKHSITTATTLYSTASEDSSSAPPSSSSSTPEMTEMDAAQKRETPTLTPEDKLFITTIYTGTAGNVEAMENSIAANLENMPPRLVVALQMAVEKGEWKDVDDTTETDDAKEFEKQMVAMGEALQNVLDVRLRGGRELLAELLNSGEIRKLDSLIGKSAKDGKLDMSFFSVLSMNMRDAKMSAGGDGEDVSLTPTLAQGEGQEEVSGEEGQPTTGANRLQILQHIYTRCQEELEKTVSPGMGLLNKVLRTEISSIRANQLDHYLGPQKTTITSPDGKTIDLGGTGKPLVSHIEFVEALSNSVTQIRTLEAAGGTDRLSAVNLVENIRQVAMEARMVLVESFGEGSDVVNEFQRDLQPVFRPGSKIET
ncbi:hypothetical protein QTG54_012135 [Skeletonema marinoi]|uniref:Uncharacterized protein n=1 Tax=Skeletonema marinoi TaxID=267567 RepID=A0AAD8Y168_9STRA|nr:hypothetical protein QTG54_012135 [Skeletonema marinoi]